MTFSAKGHIFDGTSIAEVGSIGKDNFRSTRYNFSSYNIPGETVIDSTCSKLHCIHIALAFLRTLNVIRHVCVEGCCFHFGKFSMAQEDWTGIDAADLCYSVVLLIKLICVHLFLCSHS